jgi:hypothetical protein
MKATDFLSQVALIVRERGEVYGDPRDNFRDTADRWTVTMGHKVTPAQVALCMVDLKLARLKATPGHLDSIQDAIGYLALLGEIVTD